MRALIFFLLFIAVAPAWPQDELLMWPGDTNQDSIVSVRDLLPIGLAYGVEVLARPEPSQEWLEMPAPFIPGQALPNTGVNLAHVNSDGNFRIDSLDLDAVVSNFDSLILGPVPFADQYFPPLPAPVSYCPTLRLEISPDSILVADSFFVDIFLEGFPADGVPAMDGILGLAFSLAFETDSEAFGVFPDSLITFIPSPELDLDSLMFVFAVGDTAALFRALPKGRIDLGVAAKQRNYFRMPTSLGRIQFVIDEDLIIRDPNLFIPFSISIVTESVLIINVREEHFAYCEGEADRVIIVSTEEPPSSPVLNLYPNPARSEIWIETRWDLQSLVLLDAAGRSLWQLAALPASASRRIDLSGFPPGFYLLCAQTPSGPVHRTFIRW